MKSGTSFLVGVVVGLSAGMLLKRLKVALDEEEPERVLHRINDSLRELENRARGIGKEATS
ncbi:MAG TPA: hypothetical protein VJ835_05920 [Fimbriimonadaceae bacterium]|nr:hypothetical protein [Fimbriimonadaceae bacterium]